MDGIKGLLEIYEGDGQQIICFDPFNDPSCAHDQNLHYCAGGSSLWAEAVLICFKSGVYNTLYSSQYQTVVNSMLQLIGRTRNPGSTS